MAWMAETYPVHLGRERILHTPYTPMHSETPSRRTWETPTLHEDLTIDLGPGSADDGDHFEEEQGFAAS